MHPLPTFWVQIRCFRRSTVSAKSGIPPRFHSAADTAKGVLCYIGSESQEATAVGTKPHRSSSGLGCREPGSWIPCLDKTAAWATEENEVAQDEEKVEVKADPDRPGYIEMS